MQSQAAEHIPCTLAGAYRDIYAGTPPWVALNQFLHAWSESPVDQRAAFVVEPIAAVPEASDPTLWRWAVFCAAMADSLCERDQVRRPSWTVDSAYMLAEPWYVSNAPGLAKPTVRERLTRTMPETFRRRNIFCGDRVLITKEMFARATLALRHSGP